MSELESILPEPLKTMQEALADYERKWEQVEAFIVSVAEAKEWQSGHAFLIGAKYKDEAIAILAQWVKK